MNILNPLSVEEFNEIAKNENPLNISNYEEFFQKMPVYSAKVQKGAKFFLPKNAPYFHLRKFGVLRKQHNGKNVAQ